MSEMLGLELFSRHRRRSSFFHHRKRNQSSFRHRLGVLRDHHESLRGVLHDLE